ncbi:hypothetical protein ACFY9S_05685 [Streptomyces sp. NPDC012474]|uniref:hypothetical protein n=1 Tax=Streptomyces sp. NPDC012474 TaxID=3364836 RepID=UPI0036E1B761
MQQHERPCGRRHVSATGARQLKAGVITGAVLYLPSDGTRITATGSRTVSPSASGVSTTGYPNFGANFAD